MALTPKKGGKPDPKEKEDLSGDVFMREVDDAVRASDAEQAWKKYGTKIIAAVAVVIIALAGYTLWSSQEADRIGKEGEQYVDAMDKLENGDKDGAQKILDSLKNSESPAYRAMVEFTQANLKLDDNKDKEAIAAYKKIAANTDYPSFFRDFALIRHTTVEFDDLNPQTVIDNLKPLAKAGNPFFGSAGELTAVAYMKMDKNELAAPIFAEIYKQKTLPNSLRSRARVMAGSLGIDSVQLDDTKDDASSQDDSNENNKAVKGEDK